MNKLVNLFLSFVMLSCISLSYADDSVNKKESLVKIHTQLAVAYLENNDLKAALDSANEALEADTRYSQAYLIRAYIYQLAKKYDLAEKDFREALMIDPNNSEANNNFGWFLCNRSRFDESFVFLRKALSDPFYRSPETAHLNFGICLGRKKSFEEADAQLKAALQINSRMITPLVELARLQYMQGKFGESATYFEKYYKGASGRINKDDLLLGAKIYHALGNSSKESKYATWLRNKYPYSDQVKQLP